MNNTLHSSATNEHYTPIEIIDRVTKTIGTIELDPASCNEANKIINAKYIFTKDDDGLSQDWAYNTVFCNPPGGILRVPGSKACSVQGLWWHKMVTEFDKGNYQHGIFLGFSLNLLQTCQRFDVAHPCDFPFCLPKDRINFWSSGDKSNSSPTHPNIIVLLTRDDDVISKFINNFNNIGYISYEHY